MYIFKNAMKNIWRNKGRNILLGVIILGIIISSVITLSIKVTTGEIIENYKSKFGSEVSIAPDIDKIINKTNGQERVRPIDAKEYFEFAKSEYLKESIFTSEVGVNAKNLKAVDEDINGDSNSISTAIDEDGNQVQIVPPKMKLNSSSTLEALNEFKSGKRKIIDGDFYKNKNEAIINEEFAKLNNIKVGDFIEINRVIDENKTYKLKVTGIYYDSTDAYGGLPFKEPYMNKRNEILTNIETAKEISGESMYLQAKYFLKSPEMLEEFKKELRDKGLSDGYKVTTDDASYKKIVGPVEGLGDMTLMFLFVVLTLGAVILILLNNLAIRERKYEIGVLRAIGMKKSKVALGLITESLVITAICLVMGVGAGSAVAQPVSNSLLQKQIEAQSEVVNDSALGFQVVGMDKPSANNEETISEINVKLNGNVLAGVTGVALLVVLLSSAIGIVYITKYEPRKILTERG